MLNTVPGTEQIIAVVVVVVEVLALRLSSV